MRYHEIVTTEIETIHIVCCVGDTEHCQHDLLLLDEADDVPVIGYKDYNLQAHYNEFNQRFFNDDLPTVPLRFAPLKGAGGAVIAKLLNKELIPGSLLLTMSKNYNRTSQGFDLILLHEMIHVYCIGVLHKYRENHGLIFQRKAKEISQSYGQTVPLTDDSGELEVHAERTKTIGVLLFQEANGNALFSVVNVKNLLAADENDVRKAWVHDLSSNRLKKIIAFTIDTQIWNKISLSTKAQRNVDRRTDRFHLRKNGEVSVTDLIENGKVLFVIR